MTFDSNYTCPLCSTECDCSVVGSRNILGVKVCVSCGEAYSVLASRSDEASENLIRQAHTKLRNSIEVEDQYTTYAEDKWT